MQHPDLRRHAPRWPARLWIVRHGESAGNVAREAARAAGWGRIELEERDVDLPLSARGEEQADALGHWFAALPEDERPEVVLASPYVRAQRTATRIEVAGGLAPGFSSHCLDERLRDRDAGAADASQAGPRGRVQLDDLYRRPPGGESWCDVILRLRSALDGVSLHHAGRRVLIVSHHGVVLCLRYLLEALSEQELMAIDARGEVANCSVTEYAYDPGEGWDGRMRLVRFDFTAPLLAEGAPVTTAPDGPAASP